MKETVLIQAKPRYLFCSWLSQHMKTYLDYPYHFSPSTISTEELQKSSIYPNFIEPQTYSVTTLNTHSTTYADAIDEEEYWNNSLIDTTIKFTMRQTNRQKGIIGTTQKLTLKQVDRSTIIP